MHYVYQLTFLLHGYLDLMYGSVLQLLNHTYDSYTLASAVHTIDIKELDKS